MGAMVDNILSLHATNSPILQQKLKLKETGRHQPVSSFTGKRQCRLLDQYSNLPRLTACSLRKSLFRLQFLIFKPSTDWVYGLGDIFEPSEEACQFFYPFIACHSANTSW